MVFALVSAARPGGGPITALTSTRLESWRPSVARPGPATEGAARNRRTEPDQLCNPPSVPLRSRRLSPVAMAGDGPSATRRSTSRSCHLPQ